MPFATEPHTDDSELAVSELDQVGGEVTHGSAVVDSDDGRRPDASRLVAGDDRQVPLEHGGQIRILRRYGIDDEPVDGRAVHDLRRFGVGEARLRV